MMKHDDSKDSAQTNTRMCPRPSVLSARADVVCRRTGRGLGGNHAAPLAVWLQEKGATSPSPCLDSLIWGGDCKNT